MGGEVPIILELMIAGVAQNSVYYEHYLVNALKAATERPF
ncbi:hypothetical protein CPS_1224 [Colwellia psychrerythraea 34H]|uniref:Uncharacterized protein n=1 Tax=Colwellia psychrerythraea (strain 34H / ATCC BAA-681) TaxID=167879 RepID=Q486P8_COLP3|nr:hypothetical protein CPS_1224 [Colwellia psychrerythraea 34H]